MSTKRHPDPSQRTQLRTGWTTGACATAAVKAAFSALHGQGFPDPVTITLPKGEMPSFPLAETELAPDYAMAAVVKDAGDDPDVTHGALIRATVRRAKSGIAFVAGDGVGTVTKPGLPIGVGEPAINPVPRSMMVSVITEFAADFGIDPHAQIEIAIPGGELLAARTWNPRLGIAGGLSVLGTTGIVRPFSCAAWIASIHRGIDVARASHLTHVVGSTGNRSEEAARNWLKLPDHAYLDMGDFIGGMLKYLARHPVPRLTIAGGFAKLTKYAQGANDLHSARSQVDLARLSQLASQFGTDPQQIEQANTALHALELAGPKLAQAVAVQVQSRAARHLTDTTVDVMIVDRAGHMIASCP